MEPSTHAYVIVEPAPEPDIDSGIHKQDLCDLRLAWLQCKINYRAAVIEGEGVGNGPGVGDDEPDRLTRGHGDVFRRKTPVGCFKSNIPDARYGVDDKVESACNVLSSLEPELVQDTHANPSKTASANHLTTSSLAVRSSQQL